MLKRLNYCDSDRSNSLSETLPLQEVLYSSIKDSTADYRLHSELLNNCGSLLRLPLFGRLLLSHPIEIQHEKINNIKRKLTFLCGPLGHKDRQLRLSSCSTCCLLQLRSALLKIPEYNTYTSTYVYFRR